MDNFLMDLYTVRFLSHEPGLGKTGKVSPTSKEISGWLLGGNGGV